MEEASNLSSFDLYTDLIEDHVKQKEYSFEELETKYKNVLEELGVTKTELTQAAENLQTVQTENVNLKKNFSSLLLTAKAELRRKCEEIQRLRCCLESRNRRLNRTRNPRRSLDQLSRSRGFDDSQTGDTYMYDNTAPVKSSQHDLGFSKYRLGKDEQRRVRQHTKTERIKSVKSPEPKRSEKYTLDEIAEKDSKSKDLQKDRTRDVSQRISFQSKHIAEFVSSARQSSSKDIKSSNKTVPHCSEREHSLERKDHKQRDRKIDVSRGRLDGKVVKSHRKHEHIRRENVYREKERKRNTSREKENVSSTNSKVESRKRRHGSESHSTSKRLKSAVLPAASIKDSALRKYLHTSPITSSTPKIQKTSRENTATKDKIVKKMDDKEMTRTELSIANVANLKCETDVNLRPEAVASESGDILSLKPCVVHKSVEDTLSTPKNSTRDNKLREDSSLFNLSKSTALSSGSSHKDKHITSCNVNDTNATKTEHLVIKEQPTVLTTNIEECKKVHTHLTELTEPAPLKTEKEQIVSSAIIPVTEIETSKSKAKCDYKVDEIANTDILDDVGVKTVCPVESRSSISIASAEGIKKSVLDSDSCLSVMSSVVDSSSCSSVGLPCSRVTQRQNSVCTVTSTTLWETCNGVTTWVQSEEVVNGVKKFRLRPSSSRESVTTCTSSRESLLSSPEVTPKKATTTCVEGDSKSVSPVMSKMDIIPKPCSNPNDFSTMSPFKTPSNTTSMDRIVESDDCYHSKSADTLSEKDSACSLNTRFDNDIGKKDSEINLKNHKETTKPKTIQKSHSSEGKTAHGEKEKKSSFTEKKEVKLKHKTVTPRSSVSNSISRKGSRHSYTEHTNSKHNSRQTTRKIKSPKCSKPKPNPPKENLHEASESLMSIPDEVYVFIGEESPSVEPTDDNAMSFDQIGSKLDNTESVSGESINQSVSLSDCDISLSDNGVIIDEKKQNAIRDLGDENSIENAHVDFLKNHIKADDSEAIPDKDCQSSNTTSVNLSSSAEKNSASKVVDNNDEEIGGAECISSNRAQEEEESVEEGELTSDSEDGSIPDVQKAVPENASDDKISDVLKLVPKTEGPLFDEHLPKFDLRLKLKSRQHTSNTQELGFENRTSRKRRHSRNQNKGRRSPSLERQSVRTHHSSPPRHHQNSPRDKGNRRLLSPVKRDRSRSCSSGRSAHSYHSNKSSKDSCRKTCCHQTTSPNRQRPDKVRTPCRVSERRRCSSPLRNPDDRRHRKSPVRRVKERWRQSHASLSHRDLDNRRNRSPLNSQDNEKVTKLSSSRDRKKGCSRSESPRHPVASHRSPSEGNSECSCCRHSNRGTSKTPSDCQTSPDIKRLKHEGRLKSSEQRVSKGGRSDVRRPSESNNSLRSSSSPKTSRRTAKKTLIVSCEKDHAAGLKSDSRRDVKKRKD